MRAFSNMNNVITDPYAVQWTSVLLIDHEGQNLGLKTTSYAYQLAIDNDLDLVIVSDNGEHPVCRIMDSKKQEYKRKIAERKGKTKTVKVKEVRINAGISNNDLETKTRNMDKFLKKGHHVKVTIRSRERRDEEENLQHMKEYLNLALSHLTEKYKVDGNPNSSKNEYSLKIIPQ
jgi:translation initiation factor IF-3